MRTFLLWRHRPDGPAPQRVAAGLRRLYASVLGDGVTETVRPGPHAHLVVLGQSVLNWIPPYAERDAHRWCEAIDYPLDARAVLPASRTGGSTPLLDLGAALVHDRRRWLPRLAPPFSLIHGPVDDPPATSGSVDRSPRGDDAAVYVHNDALGQAQLFCYDDGRTWALTNRIFCLRVLGVPLRPVAREWAARATLGWFPLCMTGYDGVRLLEGGTTIRVDAHGVHEDRVDVLGDWVQGPPLPAVERLELARRSLANLVDALIPQWRRPCAGLSGGWDSRVIVSTLIERGAEFRARVKGRADAQDVVLAKALAQAADLDLVHRDGSERPGAGPDDTSHSIRAALLWGAGHSDTTKHKSEFARGRRIDARELNVMGQHGELARASLYRPGIAAHGGRRDLLRGQEIAPYYVDILFALRPQGLREDLHATVREIIAEALQQAGRYEIPGFGWIDFFYLYECTRRRSSGSLTSQGSLVVAPFLNPDFIRACFAGTDLALHEDAIHRYIIEANVPAWSTIPFTRKGDNVRTKADTDTELSTEQADFYHLHGSLYYDALGFWESDGARVLEAMQDTEGFWTEVFDRDWSRAHPLTAPDEITMLLGVPDALEHADRAASLSP